MNTQSSYADPHIILLSGGSGTRLWPLSNGIRSKQFLKVLRDDEGNHISMAQRTLDQIKRKVPNADITIVTCKDQEQSLRLQVGNSYNLVVEPERRGTAAAIMLACKYLFSERHVNPSDAIIAMPIDSYAQDEYFEKIAELSKTMRGGGAGNIALLGVKPTHPSEKYGYIIHKKQGQPPFEVENFIEKPNAIIAAELIEHGALWNCGVFGFRLSHALGIIQSYGNYQSYTELRSRYFELPSNSFDCEVVEKANSVTVVPYNGDWKDLGTWNTLTEEMTDISVGRTIIDEGSSPNTHVINELDIPIIISGVSDSVVIATTDGILVCTKEQSVHLKSLVRRLEHAHWEHSPQ